MHRSPVPYILNKRGVKLRSEKEVKEIMNNKITVRTTMGQNKLPTDYEMSIFKWFLEGEPRHSHEELEKMAKDFYNEYSGDGKLKPTDSMLLEAFLKYVRSKEFNARFINVLKRTGNSKNEGMVHRILKKDLVVK